MSNPWTSEAWRIAGVLAAAWVVGLLLGVPGYALALAAGGYLLWHLYNLHRFERWMSIGLSAPPPAGNAIIDELVARIRAFQHRHRDQKRKLTAILDRFREATTAMPDGTVVTDARGRIEWFNEAATRLFGLRPGQDIGHRIDNLVRNPLFTQRLLRGEFSEPVEFPSPRDDRVMLQIHVVRFGNEQRLIIVRDVTRLHQLEKIRQDFVANVSHELRTPLTVIAGFLETMQDEPDEEFRSKWGSSLDLMQGQSTRMRQIVEDLLLLSRLESNKHTSARDAVSVPSMLASIREDAARLAPERRHRIDLDADEDLWLYGNDAELRSAFSNVVFNAVRYTPANGSIHITWQGEDGGARLDVVDDGIGIAAHHIPRLSERFYRVDVSRSRESGGTGLGLAIVKHVLSRHGGRLEIQSELGKGSRFSCIFPAAAVKRHESTMEPEPA